MEREYIGIDLHKAFFQGCAITPTGERQWEQRWPTTDEGIAGLLTRCGPHTWLAVEASSATWAFVDRIVERVGAVHVVDARKTRLKAGMQRRPTGSMRAASLTPPPRQRGRDLLSAAAIRDVRELCRYRCHLARLQASLKQRIQALLLRHGVSVPVKGLFTARGTAWLETLTLPGWAGVSLTGLRQVVTDVRAQLVPVLTELRMIAATDPIARALDARPGFGPVFSVTLRAEIGTMTRFPAGPHLASYAGLVPRVERSARRHWSGRITKAGSPWMRWALIEAAIHQFRRQDDFGRWARQLALRTGILKARVAVARALCHELFDTWPRV